MYFKSLALATLISGASASYPRIGNGYEPTTDVTDRLVIDLDQVSLQNQVGLQTDEGFLAATRIYRDGGNSKSYAKIELDSGLSASASKGAAVVGVSVAGDALNGILMEDVASGGTQIKVQYATTDNSASHVGCKIGGLPEAEQVDSGCFQASGQIEVDGGSYQYTYNVGTDNANGRTLRGFSEHAKKKMYDCPGCPYAEHDKFYRYYGIHDYGDQWVTAALAGTTTSGFTNYNANFAQYGLEGRAECAKKATAYVNVHMYVIREFRDAVDDCRAGKTKDNDDAVVAWDEGVAFYTGSLEGTDGQGDGALVFNLADKRCRDFKTCDNGSSLSGMSKVNKDLFALFSQGQGQIGNGKCDELEQTVNKIAAKMYIPLIQGTMRYAYKVDNLEQSEKSRAEGAVFAFSVLPIVAACSEDDGRTIASNMQVGASGTSYSSVVNAFERNYGCMGISQSDVGRLYDEASGSAYPLASPASSLGVAGAAVGAIVSAVVAFAMM